ncbi:chemotaxis protein [Pseudomonas agarici]|uniref:Chemotaxis protein n=2 Tax=Pseudomonas agarici TaxID=46677 RepID=A0A0X1SY50_PSEAA|nr:chemotaxis protein [Pseudomonas agarici]NWB92642.1 methyl-accepting chemotaxis protein [Pseudomonas agarici]NWC07530.1 methyl-accepting chemotaxis protein [Pseudomonas agarici]
MLENISVRAKLALGFGIVMLLTLLIATTGWLGIKSLSERGDRVLDIARLNELARDIRTASLGYTANPDKEHSGAVIKLLDNLDNHLAHDQKVFDSAINIPDLQAANAAAKNYRAHFNEFIQAIDARDTTRLLFASNSNAAVTELKKLMEVVVSPTGDPAQIEALVQAQTVVQEARFQLRSYSGSLKSELQKPAKDAIDQAVTYLTTLDKLVPASLHENVRRLQLAMTGYRTTTDQFSEAQAKADSARAQLDGDIKNLLTASQQLSQNQIAQRLEDVLDARNLLGGAVLAALLLSIIAGRVITRLIVGPLMETLNGAERVAAGNLTDSAVISRRDELGMLQLSMQRMTQNLRELIGGLRDGVVQIASVAEELSAVTQQTRSGVGSQKLETDQVATAMSEMVATVQDVARNAEQASSAAVNATQESREGDQVLAQAMTQIEKLASEVNHSTVAMSDLKQESDKIGSVLDVIKSVAQQTNLLALNAAIEAARAGEAGRGFAVVADEVRSLAQRTQTSTEEIEQLITGLQGGTEKVAISLESSRILTDSSVDLTRRAGNSLNGITQSVLAIESMNQQIATAAEQQSAVAEEINRSVINVRDIGEQTSAASEETASSSIELARLGNQLQMLVGKFTL